jgi:hypothetical protein
MFGLRYIKVPPTTWLLQYRHGKVVREGAGLACLYWAPSSSLVAIPTSAMEAPFMFEEVSADFQKVTVQGHLSFRVATPRRLAERLDFTLRPDGRGFAGDDPEKLPRRLVNLVQVLARDALQGTPLRSALSAGERIAKQVRDALLREPEVEALGIEVLGLAILAIKPTPDTARALEAETREAILRAADEASYARRNASVEQERAIRQNELDTEIAVEGKKRQVRGAQVAADASVQASRHRMEQAAMVAKAELEGKRREVTQLSAESARIDADAKAYGTTALMKAIEGVDAKVLQARFWVERMGSDFSDYLAEHERYQTARREAHVILSELGRVQTLDRQFLPNFLFGRGDVIVALGPDGLVANTLKYLDGQPVIGVNPVRRDGTACCCRSTWRRCGASSPRWPAAVGRARRWRWPALG